METNQERKVKRWIKLRWVWKMIWGEQRQGWKIEGSLRTNKRESTEGQVREVMRAKEKKKTSNLYNKKWKWFSEWHTHKIDWMKSEAGRKVKEGRNGHQLMLSPLKGRSTHTDLLDQQHWDLFLSIFCWGASGLDKFCMSVRQLIVHHWPADYWLWKKEGKKKFKSNCEASILFRIF